ncbi:MAG: hypothetical protein ACPGQS_13215 [Bradymonadia bacterium]
MTHALPMGGKITLTGYLAVSGDHDESWAAATKSMTPIKWTSGVMGYRGAFKALEHVLIATTNVEFQQICSELTSPSTQHTASGRVLLLEDSSPETWSIQIDQFIAQRLSVMHLAHLHPTTASIADHIYFSSAVQSYYDLLLLPHAPTSQQIRSRFRLWSTHLHPDRYEIHRAENPLLVERMSCVYDRLCEGYRVLTNERSRALHDYWHRLGVSNNARQLHESALINALCPPDQDPNTTARILTVLSDYRLGRWREAAGTLRDIGSDEKRNRRLLKFIKSIEQIDDFLNRDSGITSLS